MEKEIIYTGIIINDQSTFDMNDICEQYSIDKDLLQLMIEHSLIEPLPAEEGRFSLDLRSVQRIKKALHLQHDLEINLQGVVLALELIDELDHIRHELTILHRHLK